MAALPLRSALRCLPATAALLLAGCLGGPQDIGLDYSGPIYKLDDAPSPASRASVVTSTAAMPTLEEMATSFADCPAFFGEAVRHRTDCNVQKVLESQAGRFQWLYQQELVNSPGLNGSIVFHLRIDAAGRVTTADVLRADDAMKALAGKVAEHLKTVRFGGIEGVGPWDNTYTLGFAPN